jgi:hypothetical protein
MACDLPTGAIAALTTLPRALDATDYVEVKPSRGVGRPIGRARFRMSDEHRIKIQNSKVLSRLLGHVEGQAKLETSQVTAAVALLKKVLPDLQSVTVTGDAENPVYHDHKMDLTVYSDAEIETMAAIQRRVELRNKAQ